jgi:hypothetical protein
LVLAGRYAGVERSAMEVLAEMALAGTMPAEAVLAAAAAVVAAPVAGLVEPQLVPLILTARPSAVPKATSVASAPVCRSRTSR